MDWFYGLVGVVTVPLQKNPVLKRILLEFLVTRAILKKEDVLGIIYNLLDPIPSFFHEFNHNGFTSC